MADRLTQLQDAVDQLAHQFVASLYYVNRHHGFQTLSASDVVRQEKKTEGDAESREQDGNSTQHVPRYYIVADIPTVEPYNADVFNAGQRELSQDLILKEQQIEYLISVLPGLENSEKDQEQMIRQLEDELKAAEEERKIALKEKEAVLARLESVIRSVKRP